MEYTHKQMEYIDSVEGDAHQSAVRIIGELQAELTEARKKPEPTEFRENAEAILWAGELAEALKNPEPPILAAEGTIGRIFDKHKKNEVNRLTAELEVKDKLLQKVLSYGEEGLTIDETFANEIEQALKEG